MKKAVSVHPGGKIDNVNRDGVRKFNFLSLSGPYLFFQLLRKAKVSVFEKPEGKREGMFDANTTMAIKTVLAMEEVPFCSVMEIDIEFIREHEFDAP
jgi:hypothetical protein